MRSALFAFCLFLLPSSAFAQAGASQCRTSPLGASSAYCASEAFITNHFPTSSTAGHVVTFADGTGQKFQDGGAAASGTVTSVGTGQGLAGGPITTSGTLTTSTGVDANVLNAQSANYPIANTDCGKTVQMSGGSWTVTLPAVAGFGSDCTVTVVNQSTTRGQKLSGFPSDLYPILYPLQATVVKIINGAWATTHNPGRYKKQNLNFYVDNSVGNDANDGLTTGSGAAFATLNQCRIAAQLSIDTISQGNGGVTCLVTSGQTFQEFVQVFFPLVGGGTLIYQGNGGQFNWVPANSGYALQFGDLGVVGVTNVNFTTAGSTTPVGFILGHNYGVIDINTSITFHSDSPALSGSYMSCDFDAHFNINNGFNYSGTNSQFLFEACQNSSWNFNNAMNTTTSTSLGRTFNIHSGARVTFQGNVTWGTTGLGTSVGLVSGNSVLNSLGGVPPGGAPTPTTGGQYCTSLC